METNLSFSNILYAAFKCLQRDWTSEYDIFSLPLHSVSDWRFFIGMALDRVAEAKVTQNNGGQQIITAPDVVMFKNVIENVKHWFHLFVSVLLSHPFCHHANEGAELHNVDLPIFVLIQPLHETGELPGPVLRHEGREIYILLIYISCKLCICQCYANVWSCQ